MRLSQDLPLVVSAPLPVLWPFGARVGEKGIAPHGSTVPRAPYPSLDGRGYPLANAPCALFVEPRFQAPNRRLPRHLRIGAGNGVEAHHLAPRTYPSC